MPSYDTVNPPKRRQCARVDVVRVVDHNRVAATAAAARTATASHRGNTSDDGGTGVPKSSQLAHARLDIVSRDGRKEAPRCLRVEQEWIHRMLQCLCFVGHCALESEVCWLE